MACLTGALLLLAVTSTSRITAVQGLNAPLEGVRRVNGTWAGHRSSTGTGTLDIMSSADLEWFTNVTLGGSEYRVLVDSGSADLWVAGTVPNSDDTGIKGYVRYTDGTRVAGPIGIASLEFGGVTVPNQAYIQQQVNSDYPSGYGILGIGPSTLSTIKSALDDQAGTPPLANLLGLEDSTQYMTILLNRTENALGGIPGLLTLGEMQPGFEDVGNMPKLVVNNTAPGGHWMVPLDSGGVVGPDSKVIKATQGTPLEIVFDAGYTLSRVPTPITDAIYSRVPGAKYTSVADIVEPVWVVPCDFELNVTFKLGGVSYPIHPLDTVISNISDNAGTPTCIGAFQPSSSSEQPMILGAMFLRNIYLLMTFGDLVDPSLAQVHEPYMQLLPLTEPAQAHLEFVRQRLNGVDTTGSTTLLPAKDDDGDATTRPRNHSLPWIISGSVVGALVLLFSVAAAVIHFRGRRYKALRSGGAPLGTSDDIVFIKQDDSELAEAPGTTPVSVPDPMARTKYRQAMKRLSQAASPIRDRNFLSVFSRSSTVREERRSLLSDAAPPAISSLPDATSSTPSTPRLNPATSEKPPTLSARSFLPKPPSPRPLPPPPARTTSLNILELGSSPALSPQSFPRPLPSPLAGCSPKPDLRIDTGTDASNDYPKFVEKTFPNPYDRSVQGQPYQRSSDSITVDRHAESQELTTRAEERVLRIPRKASTVRPLPNPYT